MAVKQELVEVKTAPRKRVREEKEGTPQLKAPALLTRREVLAKTTNKSVLVCKVCH